MKFFKKKFDIKKPVFGAILRCGGICGIIAMCMPTPATASSIGKIFDQITSDYTENNTNNNGIPSNSIETDDVADNAITNNKIADGTISRGKLDTDIQTSLDRADVAETNARVYTNTRIDSLANGAVATNTSALSILNGGENDTGSVSNIAKNYAGTAEQNAKNYTDTQITNMISSLDSSGTFTIYNAVHEDAILRSANTYTDERINDLNKNMSAGVAGAVALSSVAVSGVERGELSVGAGYGYFNGQSAAAFGATLGISNRWSVNAGTGLSNADISFRAGTNYKFKVF